MHLKVIALPPYPHPSGGLFAPWGIEQNVSMELAAVIIAGLAALVSIVALVLGERREQKRLDAERKAGERADRAERREEERVRREELELQTSQQGQPTTDPATREPGPDRAYRFQVTNIGKSSMTDLLPMLVDASGELCSEPLPNHFLGALQPTERTEFVLKVSELANRNPLYLRYTWYDTSGFRERLSKVTVPSA